MTLSHYQHAYLLKVYHQPTRSRATTGLGWLHLLAEEETLPSPLQVHEDARSTILRRSASATATSPCQTTLSPLEPSPISTLLMGALQLDRKSSPLKRKAADQPLSATQNLISETLADTTPAVNQTLPNLESLARVVHTLLLNYYHLSFAQSLLSIDSQNINTFI